MSTFGHESSPGHLGRCALILKTLSAIRVSRNRVCEIAFQVRALPTSMTEAPVAFRATLLTKRGICIGHTQHLLNHLLRDVHLFVHQAALIHLMENGRRHLRSCTSDCDSSR